MCSNLFTICIGEEVTFNLLHLFKNAFSTCKNLNRSNVFKILIVWKNTLSIQGTLIIGMYGGTLRKIINKHGFFSKTLDITWNLLEVCNRYNIIMVSLCGTNHGLNLGQYWKEIYAKMIKAMLWAWTLAIHTAFIRLTKTCPSIWEFSSLLPF